MNKTIESCCPYCGKDVDVHVEVELSEAPQDSGPIKATLTPRLYGTGEELLRKNAEAQSHEMYPPNMPRNRRLEDNE